MARATSVKSGSGRYTVKRKAGTKHGLETKRKAATLAASGRTPKQVEVTLMGGPSHGQHVMIAKSLDRVKIGMTLYSYAGRYERRTYFAVHPKSHAGRRALMKLIGIAGQDPRMQAIMSRPIPIKGTRENPHGRGARKRAARRASLAGVAQ